MSAAARVVPLLLALMSTSLAAQLQADFSASPMAGPNTLTVQFADLTTGGTVILWIWDFGDGSTGTQQNPVHVYDAPGSYTVTLQAVVSIFSSDTETKIDYITVDAADFQPEFSASPTSGPMVLTVLFEDLTVGSAPTSWLWDFGDGSTSTEQDPAHDYVEAGTYDVSLTAFVGQQSEEIAKPGLVTVDPVSLSLPVFAPSVKSGKAPLTVVFENLTPETLPATHDWDFGDGASVSAGALQDVIHTYEASGQYSVSVTSHFGDQQESSTLPFVVTVQPANAFALGEPISWPVEGAPAWLEAIDVTSDGHPDLVTFGPADGEIRVLQNDGEAAFSPLPGSAVDGEATTWRFADVDVDGDLDVVLRVTHPSGGILTMLGDGAGAFQVLGHSVLDQSFAVFHDVGDLLEDGLPDVLLSTGILPGVGGGVLGPEVASELPIGSKSNPHEYRIGEFNGDGTLDVARAMLPFAGGQATVRVYQGDGLGGFTAFPASLHGEIAYAIWDLECGDIDGDGLDDAVATVDEICEQVLAHLPGLSDPPGSNNATVSMQTSPKSTDMELADLDGGGALEVVFLQGTQLYAAHVLIPLADTLPDFESYGTSVTVVSDLDADELAVADFDSDGLVDVATLAAGSDHVEVRLNALPDPGFVNVGGGLGGSAGTPELAGAGLLVDGQAVTASLSGAMPGGITGILLGLSDLNQAFKGGTLVPAPDVVEFGLPTDAQGALELRTEWPAGIGVGFTLWLQVWIADVGAPQGWAASNGLRITVP
jgi:PKD repeat protein